MLLFPATSPDMHGFDLFAYCVHVALHVIQIGWFATTIVGSSTTPTTFPNSDVLKVRVQAAKGKAAMHADEGDSLLLGRHSRFLPYAAVMMMMVMVMMMMMMMMTTMLRHPSMHQAKVENLSLSKARRMVEEVDVIPPQGNPEEIFAAAKELKEELRKYGHVDKRRVRKAVHEAQQL